MTSNKTFTDINENLSRSNRIKELDLARGYSILFVIATHISFFADLVFHRLFYNFPVPFFFFASSFSLTIKYKEEEKIDLKKFYKNRFHFYLPIYFLYAFIIVFIKKVVFGHYSFGAFILDYLLNASLGRIPTIWFLYVLFFFYLIFPFFLKVMKISSKFIILTLFAMSVIILTIF